MEDVRVEIMKEFANLQVVLNPTIVLASENHKDLIPEWLYLQIVIARFEELIKTIEGEKIDEASDVEALAYLYSMSLITPLDRSFARIYLWLGKKVLGDRVKELIREDLIPEELTEDEKRLLRELKKWIFKLRSKREKERIKELLREYLAQLESKDRE